MNIDKMTKEELELLSYKDITNIILGQKGAMNTMELFKIITSKLGLPKSTFENKISDYYTTITTDKRFVLLPDGTWDLRSRHTSDKVAVAEDFEDSDDEDLEVKEDLDVENDEENFDIDSANDDDEFDDSDDDLKDLVIIDEDELELEQ